MLERASREARLASALRPNRSALAASCFMVMSAVSSSVPTVGMTPIHTDPYLVTRVRGSLSIS